jgi:uncharacterized protein
MSLDDLRRFNRNEILRLAFNRGATNVRVFGSLVRGTNKDTSDIDLLVDFSADKSLLDQVGLKQDLEALLGCSVDVVEPGGISPYLAESILAEAVPL